MAKPIMPFDTDAYLADTTQLTTTAHGAYLLLLLAMWRSPEGLLRDDNELLAKTVNLTFDKWTRFMEKQLRPLLVVVETMEGRFVTQKRLLSERKKSQIPCKESLQGILAATDSKLGRESVIKEEDYQEESKEGENHSTLFGDIAAGKTKGKSLLRSDWALPPPWHHWATQQGQSDEQIAMHAKRFAAHWWSVGEKRSNWFATWQKWILNEIVWATRRAANQRKKGNSMADIAMGRDDHAH